MKPESTIEHMHHDLDSDMKAVDYAYGKAMRVIPPVASPLALPQKEAIKALYDAAQTMHINCTQNIDMLREGVSTNFHGTKQPGLSGKRDNGKGNKTKRQHDSGESAYKRAVATKRILQKRGEDFRAVFCTDDHVEFLRRYEEEHGEILL